MTETIKLKVFCNRCNSRTNHTVKLEHKIQDIEKVNINGIEESHHVGTFSYQIIECNGCNSISYRKVDYLTNFMDINDLTGEWIITDGKFFETFYPERSENSLAEKRIVGLPSLLRRAYHEVIECYNGDLRILCSAGLRAIIEGICNHYEIKGTSLKTKIDTLGANGLISKELANALHAHRFLGNFALHQLSIAETDELKTAIELIEITLENLFGVPERYRELSRRITDRVSK